MATTISLDSDDEDDACVRVAGLGTSKDAPVELSDDDDDAPTAVSGAGAADSSRAASQSVPNPAAAPSTNTAAGSGTSLVMDLTGEEEDVPGCGICGKLSGAREFRLAECGHSFCEGCVRGFVRKKVSETLAHEVGCPKCGRQLSIGNVNELAKSSGEPSAKRPRPGGPTGWRGGGPAAMLAQLAGGIPGGLPSGLPGGGHAARRVAGNPAATKRIMRELQALPAPSLHPPCTLRARCVNAACITPAPCVHPACTLRAPCVHGACTPACILSPACLHPTCPRRCSARTRRRRLGVGLGVRG